MSAHRGIVTLASALMICFLVLSAMEPEFFLLHFYESLIYLAIVLMLFYFEDKWAYMIGILAPAVWLILAYGVGLLGGAMRQVSKLLRGQQPTSQVSVMVAILTILAVLLISFCAYRWKRQYAGLGKGRTTFLVSLGIVIAYNAILVIWFWRAIPQAVTGG
jgi:uncharacterized membrane protein YidH (DUF202 family)